MCCNTEFEMRYTLNIESVYRTNKFRLNQNRDWLKCDDVYVLKQQDFYTTNRIDVVNMQKRGIKLSIDKQDFEVHPEMGTELNNENQLHYEIYGFRQRYPSAPSENQLLELLLNGDDKIRNVLILKIDGLFYLLQQDQLLKNKSNPGYVLQFEGFQPNNGYVGDTINDNRNYVQNLFRIGIFHWVNHLRLKILHDQAEIIIREENQVPEIFELFNELHQIQNNWAPDY